MTLLASLHALLPAPATDDAPPAWLHLVPAGSFRGLDGRGPYTLGDAEAVAAASMQAGKLVVDEAHGTDLGRGAGMPAPAAGWIAELRARADGLWGRVEWTGRGRALLADHAYRGVSPAFTHTKDGRVLRVVRAALTNLPNLAGLTALHATSEGASMDLLSQLRAVFGLPDTADEAAVVAAARADHGAVAAHAQQLARIAPLAGGSADPDAIVTALQARATEGDPAELRGLVVSLQSQVQRLEGERARERAVLAIDTAIKAGKPISPLRDHYIARHAADPAGVQREIDAMLSLHAGGIAPRPAGGAGGDGGLTEDDRRVMQSLGVSAETIKAGRAARMAQQNGEA